MCTINGMTFRAPPCIFCDVAFNFLNIYYVKPLVQIVDCSQSIWTADH